MLAYRQKRKARKKRPVVIQIDKGDLLSIEAAAGVIVLPYFDDVAAARKFIRQFCVTGNIRLVRVLESFTSSVQIVQRTLFGPDVEVLAVKVEEQPRNHPSLLELTP